MCRPVRVLPLLYAVSLAAAAIMMGPLLAALGGGRYFLFRDAVSTSRSYLTDGALGLGDAAPRAVPQDGMLAVASPIISGGVLVAVLTLAGLTLAGVGFGRFALRLVPDAGRVGAMIAALLSIWNPFVAERLLQGHWSLLVSFGTLGWLGTALFDAAHASRGRRVGPAAALTVSCAAAGFTPTGSVYAGVLIIGVGTALLVRVPGLPRARWILGLAGIMLIGSLPWLTAALVGSAPAVSGAGGVAAFGLRAEPWLGLPGTALGLGGIWNADAVPASRTSPWALLATAALFAVVLLGTYELNRRRVRITGTSRTRADAITRTVIDATAVLAITAVILVVVAATGPGASALTWLVETVPGAGLLRDTQKYLAPAVPFYAVAGAAATIALRRWLPAGFALTACLLLIVAPLPDLAWGVGGSLRTVTYPDDFTAVAALIPADEGAVALYPPGPVRDYGWADGPSLDPLPRMLAADVLDSGALVVDGVPVDDASGRGARVDAILAAGGSPAGLAAHGVGWVIVEGEPIPHELDSRTPVFRGEELSVYRIEGAVKRHASTGARVAALAAHTIWAAAVVVGLMISVVAGWRSRRRSPS